MDKNKKPTIEELTAELAREKARSAHLKNLLDKVSSEVANYKRTLNDYLEGEKKRAERENAKEEEIRELQRELKAIEYQREFIDMGMNEEKALETARAFLDKDTETFDANMALLIEETKKRAQDKAIQQFLANKPEVKAGNGDAEIEPAAIQFARQYVGRQMVDVEDLTSFG